MTSTESEFLDFFILEGAAAEEVMDTFGMVPENDFGRIFESTRSGVASTLFG
jgi:hypothetical protein